MSLPDRTSIAPASAGRQVTIGRSLTVAGRGLHSGRVARVTVSPAAADEGVVFLHVRRGAAPERIPASWRYAVRRPLCTALAAGNGPPLLTVEHLLAALSALRIDNVEVTVEGDELPIFDGSALPWCVALQAAGRSEQEAVRRCIRILRPVEVASGQRLVKLEPADRLSLDIAIALHKFGPLAWAGEVTPQRFVDEIAPARSFGRLKWALPLKLYGFFRREPLLRGAHLGTTAVLWGGRIIGGMRVPDEPVRHRALDVIGDLSLAGRPLLARVTARHPGHDLNAALVAKLMTEPDAWTVEPAEERERPEGQATAR